VIFQMACNRVAQPCGCTAWLELEHGQWVRKSWPCNRHEVEAWIAARDGEVTSWE
jgi:hypothetical protein